MPSGILLLYMCGGGLSVGLVYMLSLIKRSDDMKLFSAVCLMSIVSIVVMYILTLCNNYNFLSYELGIILGGLTAILGYSLKD